MTDCPRIPTIKSLIIKSATYFLKSKAKIDLLASKLEAADLEGICIYEVQNITCDALYYMRYSRYYYRELLHRANITPYNQTVIKRLAAFNYQSFAKEYGMNQDIFNQRAGYLNTGDVRGTYARLYNYTDDIVEMLETVQRDVYCWKFPDKRNIWKINQEFNFRIRLF